MSLKTEIFEQPNVIRGLLDRHASSLPELARRLQATGFENIYLAARGTSDYAALYAQYLFGAYNGLPVALAAPSLFTRYQRPPSLRHALVMGISQSGQSPDIVRVLQAGREQGRPTLAITNQPDSPLAQAADFVIPLWAGEEHAVAATKTYTAELFCLALLSAALVQDPTLQTEMNAALRDVPAYMEQVLDLEAQVQDMARAFRFAEKCVVLGRGFNYATACEWAQKLKELTYMLTEPYSPADFEHGPRALVQKDFPVLAVTVNGPVFDATLDLLRRLVNEQAADLLVVSDRPEALDLARYPIPLPQGMPEWTSPLVAILPGQMFARSLALERGRNTENPRSIQKVTRTV